MNIVTRQPDDPIAAFGLKIPDLKNIIKGELAQNGQWLVANISTDSFWPINSQKVRWRGVDIWIMPVTKSSFPRCGHDGAAGQEPSRVRRTSGALPIDAVVGRGARLHGRRRRRRWQPAEADGPNKEHGLSICEEFDLSYFPEVTDEDAMLALALMREGRGLNHAGYAFLAFYRVLEVAFPKDKKRIAWITASLANLTGHGVKEALAGITAQGITDVGKHLYELGRCAMAHANRQPIVDPDKPDDIAA